MAYYKAHSVGYCPLLSFLGLALALLSASAQAPSQGLSQARHPAFLAAMAEQRPGKAVSRIGALSEYQPALKGTALDSPVYFIEPQDPNPALPAILILGGSHGDEIAGVAAASLFVSWARPSAARLIVVPRANASAATWPDPDRPGPQAVYISGASGDRSFRYGSRLTKPEDETTPELSLADRDLRNLNRLHPGDAQGSKTAQAAAAIFALIIKENVKAAFDLHEASPVSGLAWNIIAHPKNLTYAAMGILAADERGVRMVLDQSRDTHRGLSHREWGQGSETAAYLIETLNPGQVSGGRADMDHLDNAVAPLWKRVGIQVETVLAILSAHSEMDSQAGWAEIRGMPGLEDLKHEFTKYF
ncbi:MAG: hypothetical protein FD137_544 [Spirochaetes bacterium]|nr:MAG: hypothetical protein FD137_544 [Spirochaetota bacterium]